MRLLRVSFLDPYSGNRRISPLLVGRIVVLLVIVAAVLLGLWLLG